MSRIRLIVAGHGALGVSAPEVVTLLGKQGVRVSLNGVHAAFSKLKKAGLVTSKSGKCFPTNRLSKPTSTGSAE